MPVNFTPATPEQLLPVAGVALGIAEAGIKKADRKDLLVIKLEQGARVAGVFTKNRFCAAPVTVCQEHLAAGNEIRALVVNTGNANAGTGEDGLARTHKTCAELSALLGCEAGQVLPFSTGVIMEPLPVDRIVAGLPRCVADLRPDNWHSAAQAIMTTDIVHKALSKRVDIGGATVTITGIAKGSGMIHTNMATMLAFITTDAAVSPPLLRQALRRGTDKSFNMITVDGDTSTNDMAVILANGLAGNPVIAAEDAGYAAFSQALEHVMIRLAKMIVKDGEGASKVVAVTVKGAADQKDARAAAMSIANSNLVKTAVFGSDANWGRIIAAVGYSEARFQPNAVDIFIGDVQTTSNGHGVPFNEECVREFLGREEVAITVDLKAGPAAATVWTCDLTYEYVRINGSYRT